MAFVPSEVVWTMNLLEELEITCLKPIQLHCDNQFALHIAQNPVFHRRTKHIDIDYLVKPIFVMGQSKHY